MQFEKKNLAVTRDLKDAAAFNKNVIADFHPDSILAESPRAIGSEVIDFRGYFKVEDFPINSVVYRPGETSGRVYLLKYGRVRLMRPLVGAHRAVTSILRAGELFGEISFGMDVATQELAITATQSEVWSIDSEALQSLVETNSSLGMDIIRVQSDRIRKMRQRAMWLTFKDVPARLAATLLELGEALGEPCAHGGELDLRGITQQDLADLVGASRSFVSTLINEMKRDGILSNVGRVLCIRSRAGLMKLADADK